MKKINTWIIAAMLLVSSLPMSADAGIFDVSTKHKKTHIKHKKFKGQKSLNSKIHKRPTDPSYR